MPLYEYKCEKCGRFERIVKFSDPPLAACPTCGGTVQKLFSSPAIQFKGSGFYITDYAKKSSPDGSGGKSTDKSSADKSSSDGSSSDKGSGEKSSGEKSDKSSSDSSSTSAPAAAATTSKD
jgi:putative FmdB family regulatory protein